MIMLPGDWDFFILLKNYKIGSSQIWGNFPLNVFVDKLFANEKNIVMLGNHHYDKINLIRDIN